MEFCTDFAFLRNQMKLLQRHKDAVMVVVGDYETRHAKDFAASGTASAEASAAP